jgi:hypothetical protein
MISGLMISKVGGICCMFWHTGVHNIFWYVFVYVGEYVRAVCRPDFNFENPKWFVKLYITPRKMEFYKPSDLQDICLVKYSL